MPAPKAYGGIELHPTDCLRLWEAVARIDAAAAWNLVMNQAIAAYSAWLPLKGVAELFAGGIPTIAGALHPPAKAVRVDGGWRITGQVPFASGCHHTQWLVMPAQEDGADTPFGVFLPIAIGISQEIGGHPSLTAVLVITGGIIGAMLSGRLYDWIGVGDWEARGLATGIASHGIGTAQMLSVKRDSGCFRRSGDRSHRPVHRRRAAALRRLSPCVVSFFTLSKRKGLPHLSGSRRLRSSRFRTTTSYCGRGSRTIVVIPNNNKLLRTRIAYDRRDSEQQQVTADEDRGRLVRRP
jgi:LrgB-like family